MKFCNNCGESISSNSKFCLKCGKKLDINLDNTSSNTNNDNTGSKIKTKKELNYKEKVTVINKTTINEPSEETIKTVLNENIKSNSYKKSRKKLTIIAGIILLIVIGIFIPKDTVLYKYYSFLGDKKVPVDDKLQYYNKALSLEYNNKLVEKIYELIKDDSNFEDKINALNTLKEEDKNELVYKICTYNSEKYFNKKNYDKALKYINIASKNGYSKTEFDKYDDILSKIEEEKQEKKDNDNSKTNTESESSNTNNNYENKNNNTSYHYSDVRRRINSSYDFIEPTSDVDFLNESYLKNFDKQTLALIRNEIFARRGYVFHTEPFKTHFNSKTWYYPDPYFKGSESELNTFEKANVKLIQKLENKK